MEQKGSHGEILRIGEEFERSGLKRRQFCEQNNVPVTTLDYWRWCEVKAGKSRLVKVTVANEKPSPGIQRDAAEVGGGSKASRVFVKLS
jgi:hypothetical protein